MASRVRVSQRNHRGETVLQVWEDDDYKCPSPCSPPARYSELEGCGYSRGFSGFLRASRSMRRFYDLDSDVRGGGVHFLQACHRCKRPLGQGDDIYMYKGDTPFCSEECRQEQIDADESDEQVWGSVKAMQKKSKDSVVADQKNNRTVSPGRSDDLRLRTGTVAAG